MNINQLTKHFSSSLLWTLFLVVFLLPSIYLGFNFYSEMQRLNLIEEKIEFLQAKATRLKKQQEKETMFLTRLKEADHFFIDKQLESCVFLENELKNLKLLDLDPSDPLKKRLQFLKGNGNRLLFIEEKTRRKDGIQEIEEKLQHPVEMNEEDLKKILSLIEGNTIGIYEFKQARPQLIIKQFDLIKKALSPQEEVFEVSVELIKREAVSQ